MIATCSLYYHIPQARYVLSGLGTNGGSLDCRSSRGRFDFDSPDSRSTMGISIERATMDAFGSGLVAQFGRARPLQGRSPGFKSQRVHGSGTIPLNELYGLGLAPRSGCHPQWIMTSIPGGRPHPITDGRSTRLANNWQAPSLSSGTGSLWVRIPPGLSCSRSSVWQST